jgi:hypothetical protein
MFLPCNAYLWTQVEHFEHLWTSKFVSNFIFSCTALAMVQVMKREPELLEAQHCARWSQYKITSLYNYSDISELD